jgi:diguanylate cyclase (GGDEF)-like protein/PAS domain S-box-containing protein
MERLSNWLNRSSFRRQLTLAVTVGAVCIAVFSSLASSLQGSRQIRQVLQAQGERIAENLAQQSALAVIYNSAAHAADALKVTLGFPDVIAVEIRDANGRPVAVRGKAADAGPVAASAAQRGAYLEAESDDVWRFVAPILVEAEGESPLTVQVPSKLLGHVRVVLSKATLTRMRGEIFAVNLGTASLVSLVFLLVIRGLTGGMTRPLSQLSATMARAERGDARVQADPLSGPRDIAEMARAFNSMLAALREREERFRSLAALSSDWYWERDEEGRLTLLSQGFAEITGIDPNELLGTRRGDDARFQYPADQARDCDARIAAYEPFYGLEWQLVRPDGQLRHGTASGEPIFDARGRFRGYRGIGKDTTAVKLAETAQQSVIRLREMVEHLPAGAVYIEGGAILLNRAAEAITGYSRGEIGSVDEWFDRVCGADAERVRRQYAADRAAQFPAAREIAIVRKDGAPRFIEFAGYGDANGEVWLLHDITQRRTVQAALEQALLEQQVIFDNASVTLALVKDRVIQRCNSGMEKMLGYAPGELNGMPTRRFYVCDEDYEALGREAYPMIAAGLTWSGEHQMVRKDGRRIWSSTRARAVDPKDPSKGAIFVAQDVTESKHYEAALVAAKERLERGLAEVERTQREVALLSELSGFLQACPTEAEAAAGIGEYAPRLLPDGLGALYLIDDAEETLVAKVRWGDPSIALATTFLADECWALRRAHAYRLDHPTRARCCPHLGAHGGEQRAYACLPLMAQGRIFGLLFVEHRGVPDDRQIEARHRLAVALAEQVGLGLANIRLRETLRQQSIRDPLTGLFNRRYMNETLRRELARAERKASGLAVAVIDIDHFKRFNDTFGHDAGDAVLSAVAHALEQTVRQSDVVCRLGGEEFVVLLPGLCADLAELRAADLLQAIRGLSLEHGQRSLGRITASLGLAFHPEHGQTADALIEAADAALYEAKSAGRDRVAVGTAQPSGSSSAFGTL